MSDVYEIFVQDHFSSAHQLKGYDGNCSKIHGHNWIIEAYIECRKLNKIGIGIDFRDIRRTLKDVLKRFDHTNLNDLEEFSSINPTSENISKLLYKELSSRLNADSIKVTKIKVLESPGCGSTYWEE